MISLRPLRKLANVGIGKQAQMKKLPRISRSGENPAQPYPPHRRSATRSNILAPVAQASATGSFLKKLAFGCVCLRDGSQDVGRRPPVWGVWLRGLWVCAGFIRALIRAIRAIRGCFIFCGFINATEFLMSMNDTPPQELCGLLFKIRLRPQAPRLSAVKIGFATAGG